MCVNIRDDMDLLGKRLNKAQSSYLFVDNKTRFNPVINFSHEIIFLYRAYRSYFSARDLILTLLRLICLLLEKLVVISLWIWNADIRIYPILINVRMM